MIPTELQPGTYAIPEDCTFKYANRQIIVVPKKTKDTSIRRCGTCAHIRTGKKCCKDQFWDTQYCVLKPKTIGGKTEYFYHVTNTKKLNLSIYKVKPPGKIVGRFYFM